MPELTPYKVLAKVRDLTGYQIRLGVFEELAKVDLTDDEIRITVRRFRVKESRSQYRITHEGLERFIIKLTPDGWARECSDIIWMPVADEVMLRRGTCNVYESITDYREQRDFELDCHRPGTSRFPLDSAQASDTERMYRHWKLA